MLPHGKRLALALTEAGVKVQAIGPFRMPGGKHQMVMTIGTDPEKLLAPPYTVESLESLELTRSADPKAAPAPPD